jgi:alkanesulfonate monooxygenase SsuD/methylene tetrahydromethanopterin reductase-like flavin-dependent oxidoreductase (luciferase family)
VPPSRMRPRPVQVPGPPVLLGGSAPAALRRAGRAADGWVSRSGADLTRIADDVAVVRAAARDAGRDPDAVRVVSRGVVRAGSTEDRPLAGSYQKIRDDAARLGEAGVTELFYDLNWDPLVGAPDAEPAAAIRRGAEIMAALAP